MRTLFRLAAILVGIAIAWPAAADYLEIRRPTTVKQDPSSDSDVIARPKVGDNLDLLDGGTQTNGYYHVLEPDSGQPGWVYRTFVTRYEGRLPGQDSGPPPAAPNSGAQSSKLSGDTMKVHYIDVGQGNSALVEFSCGAVLIDAGGESPDSTQALLKYLDDFFARRTDLNKTLNAIFITHTHVDHNRSLRSVVEKYTVQNYIHNGIYDGSGRAGAGWMRDHANDNGRKIKMREVGHDEVFKKGDKAGVTDDAIDPVNCSGVDPKLRVLQGPYEDNPGWSEEAFDNGNNKGIVIRIDFGKSSFLFPGDTEEEALEELVSLYRGSDTLRAGVLLVSHHGSYNATTTNELAAISPELAVISMGTPAAHKPFTAWQYGHPREVAVKLLTDSISRLRAKPVNVQVATAAKKFTTTQMRKAVYATGWDGTIVIEADKDGHYVAANDNLATR